MGTGAKITQATISAAKQGTLAEAEAILKNLQEQEQAVADTFFTQEETIQSLTEVIKAQDQEVAYISPPAPEPQRPNYVLYVALGILAWLFLRR